MGAPGLAKSAQQNLIRRIEEEHSNMMAGSPHLI
jgi:hypothetical protein